MSHGKFSTPGKVAASVLALGLVSQASAFEFQAGDVNAKVYGYARLNATYDIDEDISTSRGTRSGDFSKVNTGDAEDSEVSGHFGADAFQSRIGVRATTPEGVAVTIEGDFRSFSGSPGNLRLRHAYGEYNGVLMGRTWSNFNSFIGLVPNLEFDPLAGSAGYTNRISQVRYSTGPVSIALEDTVSRIDGTDAEQDRLPTLTARYESRSGGSGFAAAALVHQVGYDDSVNDDTAVGYAVFGAAKLALTDTLSVMGSINYTDGANGYLWRSGSNFYGQDAYLNGDSVETIVGYGGTLGASLKVGPGAITAGVGSVTMDWDDAEDDGLAVGDQHERNSHAILNYQWSPVKNVKLGVQYSHYRVKLVNGDDGDANRLHFAGQYNF
ncbi:DcaP family trimeric outer membrane transporter [Marinobacter sp. SS21]|uniref:DcaP family trimeric outer membrane transporter n=1 Tax=Marinobacter sp. SS21 TaxID=2979460 RepID=UPI00232BA066|nr:DcaP family trimeric outer membrane transporter [Marinobacter sp. SS21]MDC0662955.1 DcaP family trimeric outer membrane transporter [Marinobacter sp. SS21]